MLARSWHGVLALLVVLAIALQLFIAYRVPGGPGVSETGLLEGTGWTGRFIRALSSYDVQCAILAGVVAVLIVLDPTRDRPMFRAVRLTALIGTTLASVVYTAVLSEDQTPTGYAETTSSALLHYVIPVATVIGWVLVRSATRIDGRAVVASLVFPLAWVAYSLVRGEVSHWYPYPFIDVAALGYTRVAVNLVAVLCLQVAIALAFASVDKRLSRSVSSGRRRVKRRIVWFA